MKAIWKDTVVAESDDTLVIEGNHYFPLASLKRELTLSSNHRTMCSWKGQATYLSLFVNGDVNPDAAWYFAEPLEGAKELKDRVAFWKGVQVTD